MALDQTSNTKYLQVFVNQPNPDAGWYVEAYDKTNVTKKVIDVTILEAFFNPVMNSIGSGYIDVPVDDPAIDLLISPENKVTTLLRVYLDGIAQYVFFSDNLAYKYDENGNAVTSRISGQGMEVVADRAIIGNADYPASPSLNSKWKYGSNENFVANPSFDEELVHLKNPGGEDGNTASGEVEGWTKFGNEIISAKAVKNPGNSRLGDWYIEMDASDYHNGYRQSVSVTPNRTYHVISYAKDPTAAGMRITMSLGGADDMASTGTYSENYEYKQKWYAELGNVARNPAKNGLPGGSTDGTWQRMDIEVTTGGEQTSLEIAIQSDHHGTFTDVPFWVDDVSIEGWGLGLEPWVVFDATTHENDSFRQDTDIAYDSSSATCVIKPTGRYAGIEQLLSLNPSTKYTASIWGTMPFVLPGDTWRLEMIANDGNGTLLGSSPNTQPVTGGVWTNWEVVVTTPADDKAVEVFFRYVYTGTNNPGQMNVDSASCVPGEPAGTAGKILNDVLTKIRARGELESSWFQTSFSDTKDSKGYDWPAPLALDIDPSETLYGLLSRLVALGHEWNIVPINFDEGGDSGFMFNVYTTRSLNPNSGIDTNWEFEPNAPVIMPSDATIGGRVQKNVNLVNRVVVSGTDGIWAESYQEDYAAYKAAFGSISEYITAGDAADSATLATYAGARLAELRYLEYAIQLNMQRSSVFRPFLHFGIGASLLIDMPPYFEVTEYQRIRSITTVLKGEGTDITFVVDVSRVLYEDEMVIYAKVAQLAERAPRDTVGKGSGRVSAASSVSAGIGTGTDTAVSTPHTHSLLDTDITDKILQGDVGGTLPGPLSVNALKGIQFDSTVPVDDGSMTVLEYDRIAKQFGIATVGAAALVVLDDLADVNAPTPIDKYILAWDDGASEWIPYEQRFDRDTDVNMVATPSIPSVEKAWSADQFDGITNWLGTSRGILGFANPELVHGVITSSASTTGLGATANLVGEDGNIWRSTNVPNSWVKFDMGAGKLVSVDRFGINGEINANNYHPRVFIIEGSIDDINWTTIIDVDGVIVTSGVLSGTWDSWVGQETTPGSYRYIRLTQYGPNLTGSDWFAFRDIEIWGRYFDPTPPAAKHGDIAIFNGYSWVPHELTQETTWNDQGEPLVKTSNITLILQRLYATEDRELISVHASVSDPNSGGTTDFDIKVDGVSVLASSPLTIPDLAYESGVVNVLHTRWDNGSYVTVEITNASGSASRATVTVKWRRRGGQ